MTPLALAMILTGAGAVAQKPHSPPILYVPPLLPVPVPAPSPPPVPTLILPPGAPRVPVSHSVPWRARADFNTYFSVDDYPLSERRHGAEARVGFAIVVGPDGRVSRCTVTTSSGSRRLDRATCDILTRRARYLPARNALGVPIDGRDSGTISWPIPSD